MKVMAKVLIMNYGADFDNDSFFCKNFFSK